MAAVNVASVTIINFTSFLLYAICSFHMFRQKETKHLNGLFGNNNFVTIKKTSSESVASLGHDYVLLSLAEYFIYKFKWDQNWGISTPTK